VQRVVLNMKNITRLLALVLLLGSGYFVWKHVVPNILPNLVSNVTKIDPMRLDDAYKINIERDASAESPNMTIKNNSAIDLRLHMFNASDKAKVIARENWVLKRGESKSYPRDSYVFHVWKSQFFDASIKWTDSLWTDVEFSGNESNLTVKGRDKPPVTIRNDTDEQLKFCTYNAGDIVQAVPLKCWTLGSKTGAEWKNAPQEFMLKVFKPALLDDPVLTQSSVKDMSAITIAR